MANWNVSQWEIGVWSSGPEFLVELGLAADVLDDVASITWTDITGDVLSWSCSRGRAHELDDTKAGTAVVVVDNKSGDYDPFNSSGAHYPNLQVNRRLRISVIYHPTTYRLFTGYIDAYRVNRIDAWRSTVEIQVTDAFKLLNLTLLDDPYSFGILAEGPRAYWKFDEEGGAALLPVHDHSGNGRGLELYHALQEIDNKKEGYEIVDFARSPTGRLLRSWDQALETTNSAYAMFGRSDDAGVSGTGDFSIVFSYRPHNYNGSTESEILAQATKYVFLDAGPAVVISELLAEERVALRLRIVQAGVVTEEIFNNFLGWFDSENVFHPHNRYTMDLDHFIITRSGTAWNAYIQPGGAFKDTPVYTLSKTAAANYSLQSSRVWLGADNAHSSVEGKTHPGGSTMPGDIAGIAFFDFVLSAGQRTSIWANLDRWDKQYTGDRIGSILDMVGWPAADRNIETGAGKLRRFPGGEFALAHLQDVARAEDGLLFVAGDGKVTFYGRHHLITDARSTTSQATFGDEAGEVGYEAAGLDPSIDEKEIFNHVVCQREGGAPQEESDAASIAQYGKRTLAETGLLLFSDTEAAARAQFKRDLYSTPQGRVRTMTISRDDDSELFYPVALGLELWDRVTYRQRLVNSALWEQASIVEGLSHSFDGQARKLKVTVHMSTVPGTIAGNDHWTLNTSGLNADTRVAY